MTDFFDCNEKKYISFGKNASKSTQNDGTKVTVICVTYAHEAYIAQTLESIVSQKTTFKFQVFVGEDCGPDNTANIVLEYARKYPEIVIPFIREKNLGPKKNLVDLIEHATSPYICFCDGDDYWIDENKLQKQYDYMEDNLELRACFARAKIEAPEDWYLNDYFKPNRDGDRIMPDCIPGFKIPNRYLDAKDIIKYHPMHTVTVFYRWNYDIGFPDWFFYGVLGDIPMSLLQIGDGKVGFLPDLVAVYRRSDVGVHMFTNKDEHFLQTRKDYFNYLEGIYDDFQYRFGNFAKNELENRMKQEWNNYIRAALRCEKLDEVAESMKGFAISAQIAMENFCTFYEDGRRMYGNYGASSYRLIARERVFLHGFAPILKVINKMYCTIKKIFRTNWFKQIAKLPFTLIFDKILPNYMVDPFSSNVFLFEKELPEQHTWKDFLQEKENKKIIFCGFGEGVWKWLERSDQIDDIFCIIGFGEERSLYKGIPIVNFDEFAHRIHDIPENVVYLLTDCNPMRLSAAMQYMQDLHIKDYFSFCFMEKEKFKKIIPLYQLKYWVREYFHKNGLMKNLILFNFKNYLRRIHLLPDWRKFQRLSKFKNIHEGETCYIVGTGPSLRLHDIDKLKGKITFSVNGIYRMFDQTDWRPTYYAICDPNACVEIKKYYSEHKIGTDLKSALLDSFCDEAFFYPDIAEKWVEDTGSSEKGYAVAYSYLDQHINPYWTLLRYNEDITQGSYNMRTVVNFCINIAHYMGFKSIVLLGVDCNYLGDYQYFDGSNNIHVTDKKTKKLRPYNAIVTQKEMLKAYQYVKDVVQKQGVHIVNATRGGNLNVFERKSLDDTL